MVASVIKTLKISTAVLNDDMDTSGLPDMYTPKALRSVVLGLYQVDHKRPHS